MAPIEPESLGKAGDLVNISAHVPSHNWRECRPATLEVDTGSSGPRRDERDLAQINEVMVLVWSRLRDNDRQAFHRVCCLNSRDPDDVAVMRHLSDTMSGELKRRGL